MLEAHFCSLLETSGHSSVGDRRPRRRLAIRTIRWFLGSPCVEPDGVDDPPLHTETRSWGSVEVGIVRSRRRLHTAAVPRPVQLQGAGAALRGVNASLRVSRPRERRLACCRGSRLLRVRCLAGRRRQRGPSNAGQPLSLRVFHWRRSGI